MINIEDMIYKEKGEQVMIALEIPRTKCYDYLYHKMITNNNSGGKYHQFMIL